MREKIKESNEISKATNEKDISMLLRNDHKDPPLFNGDHLHDSSITTFEMLANASDSIFNAIKKKACK